MFLCVSKQNLGTKKHLLYDGQTFKWVTSVEIPKGTWWDADPRMLKDMRWVATACKRQLIEFPDIRYKSVWKSLISDDRPINWHKALPAEVFKKQLSAYVDQLWCFLKQEYDSYYCTMLLKHREFLEQLEKPKINVSKFQKLYAQSTHQKNNLEKFKPGEEDFCQKPTYDLISSTTGRLIITKGPNILTLSKELRGIFNSSHSKGTLLQIDLKTLEPRIAIYMAQNVETEIDDIYTDLIIKELGIDVTRDVAKKIVISTLYGMSHNTLSHLIPANRSSREILNKIQHVFGVEKLTTDLKTQINTNGYFKNLFGRKLKPTNALVNHFLQSSGVDISLIIFREIIEKLKETQCIFKPLFVIHDALILDVRNDYIDHVKKICHAGFSVPTIKLKFPVKISKFE